MVTWRYKRAEKVGTVAGECIGTDVPFFLGIQLCCGGCEYHVIAYDPCERDRAGYHSGNAKIIASTPVPLGIGVFSGLTICGGKAIISSLFPICEERAKTYYCRGCRKMSVLKTMGRFCGERERHTAANFRHCLGSVELTHAFSADIFY